jgi:hypothetical protein
VIPSGDYAEDWFEYPIREVQPIFSGGNKARSSNTPEPSMMKNRADMLALEKEAERLLSEIAGTGAAP